MSKPIIKTVNLGKNYLIRHQSNAPRYRALRDEIAGRFKDLGRRVTGGKVRDDDASRETFWALKDINLEIEKGDVVGIIGRNGAGKSTLLKVLSRITEPSTGRIELRGRVASLLEVGTGFHPELTGRENIYLNGAILGMTRQEIKRKFDEIVEFAEVEKFLDTPVKRYSSGMYVRLAFAVAAHLEPEILIVDEVLAVGDVQFQKKCLGKMGDVSAGEGRTVLFVSHNMSAVQALCKKGLYLKKGEIVSRGEIAPVIGEYMREFRASKDNDGELAVKIIPGVYIDKLSFTPNHATSGDDIDYQLILRSTEDTRLDYVMFQIYSASGQRVAVMDLRRTVPTELKSGEPYQISGTIKSLSLVPGEYSVAVWVANHDHQHEVTDLEVLTIDDCEARNGLVPISPQHRGMLELQYNVEHSPAIEFHAQGERSQ